MSFIVDINQDQFLKEVVEKSKITETNLELQTTNITFQKFFEYGDLGNCDRYAFAGRIAKYEILRGISGLPTPKK